MFINQKTKISILSGGCYPPAYLHNFPISLGTVQLTLVLTGKVYWEKNKNFTALCLRQYCTQQLGFYCTLDKRRLKLVLLKVHILSETPGP